MGSYVLCNILVVVATFVIWDQSSRGRLFGDTTTGLNNWIIESTISCVVDLLVLHTLKTVVLMRLMRMPLFKADTHQAIDRDEAADQKATRLMNWHKVKMQQKMKQDESFVD